MILDLKIFIIAGLFIAIFLAFCSQIARTEERIEHPPNSWMNVFNMLIIIIFVCVYIFLLTIVLGKAIN